MQAPAPFGAIPAARQLAWHAMEMYGFVHFTTNTFTDREWGYGDESPQVFNPTALDTRQWARVAKEAGLKGLILTAKHHDGFCLWPSRYTEHSVKHSPWRGGKGDVVAELHDACAEFGLKLGLYLSPWDRNHAEYGRGEYVTYYHNQLEELMSRYPGELFEVWFDGANGGDGFYGGARETRTIDRTTYYNFPRMIEIVRQYQPNACCFSDAGPEIRWVGNESGRASATSWNAIFAEGIYPGQVDDINRLAWGEADGTCWRPPEVDVSLRHGWFWHAQEQPHSLKELLAIYFASVGYGSNLNLNLPPNREGLIPDDDIRRLGEFRSALDAIFADDLAAGRPVTASATRGDDPAFAAGHLTDGDPATYWATDDAVSQAELIVDLGEVKPIGCLRLEEYITLGQRVEEFAVDAALWDQWLEVAHGTTIGARKIMQLLYIRTQKVRIRILKSRACPVLSRLSVFATAE